MPREQRINLQKRAVTAEALGQVGGGIQALQGQQYEAAYVPKSDGQKLTEGLGMIAKATSVFATQKAGELQKASDVKRQAEGHDYAVQYINNANETISQLPIAERPAAYEKALMEAQNGLANSGQTDPVFYQTVMRTITEDFAAFSHQDTLANNALILGEDKRKLGNVLTEVVGKPGIYGGVERVGTMQDAMKMAMDSKYFTGAAEAREFVMSHYLNEFTKRLVSDPTFYGQKSKDYINDHFKGKSADGQIDLAKDKVYGKYLIEASKANTIQRGQVIEAQKQAAVAYYSEVSKASYVQTENPVKDFPLFKDSLLKLGSDGLPLLSSKQRKEAITQYNLTNSGVYSIDTNRSGAILRKLEGELWTGNANKDTVNALLKDLTLADRKIAFATLDEVSRKENAATITDKKGIIREEISQYFSDLGYSKTVLLSLSGKGKEGHMEHAIRSKVKQKLIAWRQEKDKDGKNNMLINLDLKTIQEMIGTAGTEVKVKPYKVKRLTPGQTSTVADLTSQQEQKSLGPLDYIFDWLGYVKSRD